MDAENKPAENEADAVSPPATLSVALRAGPVASDKSSARWGLILLVLCAVGAGLVIGILALQVTEYLFYKAPPDVWPQPGAGGAVSVPATFTAPATATTTSSGFVSSAMPLTAATTAAPSEAVTSAVPVAVATAAFPETATSTVPVTATTTMAPSATAVSMGVGVTSAAVVAATSAPAPAAAMP